MAAAGAAASEGRALRPFLLGERAAAARRPALPRGSFGLGRELATTEARDTLPWCGAARFFLGWRVLGVGDVERPSDLSFALFSCAGEAQRVRGPAQGRQ